ncbi:MAG: 1-(5-phosphoribosyl)-5-[(5-phosphoribosylamino)methylideneamino]imidazole-4-carboxamide isomerase [Bacteroidetes bacterium]|nr:1-(5-phosphoribosyl)-5-[(5-phosphoribosylamino)methylideneamino]imidazole-4-carboxamide isomerase [Bacteroidota bacterium]
MQIIPAIDIIEGKCVRLTEGDYSQKKIYNEHPLEVALQFQDAGLERVHLVDLDGAKAGKIINWKVLELLATKTSLKIDFGGGIKKQEDVRVVLEAGALWATVGSVAVKDKTSLLQWLQHFGADKFLLGADVKGEQLAVGGWLETTNIHIYDFIAAYLQEGIEQIFCTDISKDGRLEGPSLQLYQSLLEKNNTLQLIASGGVSSIQDLEALRAIGCAGAIVGKAIYEGRISIEALTIFQAS